jgi:6-phosphogluconolactonase
VPGGAEVLIFPDLRTLSEAAAERVVRRGESAHAERGEFAIALAGGETPHTLYATLAREPFRSAIRWERVRVFWGDERCVPPQDPRSNFRMAQDALLSLVPIPPQNIHRMPAERADLASAAREYADVLRSHLPRTADGWPRFDLILLGLGEDGHTASLFPHAPVLTETRSAVAAYHVPHLRADRMTLIPPVLNRAREVLFLVSGAEKAHALWVVLEGPRQPEAVPAQVVRPLDGSLVWLVDEAAAQELSRSSLLSRGDTAR